ncbi:MAG: PSD1 and planctomycete cytochrome C domain-containing protein [Verrucomicrobiales bacterium]
MKSFVILAITLCSLPPSLQAVDFAHEVMPILKEHCAECHTGNKKKGGLAINTRAELLAGGENGAVAVSGDSGKSHMIKLITSADDSEWMPPKGPRLPPEKIAILKKWIDAGLPWEPGISLAKSAWEPPLKPRTVALPPALKGREHPIDRILDADLAKRDQPLPAAASDAAMLRRVTLDAIGLLPTPEDLNQYLNDPDSGKFTKKIDALLNNDIAYADHWLTTWNDLLRNDYTGTGFITKGRTQITTWLYQALRENKPYDHFVRELIAPPDNESAGFINGIKWRGDVNASQTPDIQFAQNISQVFLGINMKCASCHDSFIDRWTLAEAYNLAAIFSEQPLELNRCDKPIGVMATPKWIFPELGDVDAKLNKPERLKQLAGLMTHPENGRFTRTVVNRIWERLMGRGIVHPVDAMDTRPWNEDLLDYLAVHFAGDGYDLRKFIRFVMTSQAYQSKTIILEKEPGEDYAYSGPIARRMSAEQFIDTIWQITGTNPTKADAQANRGMAAPADAPPVRAALVQNDFLMRSLGRPHRDQVVTTRPSGLTTLQAIDLANGDILANYLKTGAQNLTTKKLDKDLREWLYQYAFSRPITASEQTILNEVATGDQPKSVLVEDLLWLVFMQPEYQIIR